MGRVPTWAILLAGVFLLAGVGAAGFMLQIKPAQDELQAQEDKLEEEKAVAAKLDATEQELEQVTAEWLEAQDELQALREARSIPISFGHPAGAMIALWYEYRHDLVPLIEDWVQSTGCTIESGASFPAPPMTPPSAPPSGFMQIPANQTITLTVSGTLTQIERLYRSLDQFERVVTISDLVLQPQEGGEMLQAQIPLKIYLLVEAPAGAAGGGGGGAAPGGPPGPDGPPGAPPDAPPGAEPDPGGAPPE
jgi:Tfp pilus assembly protein PilO